MMETDLRRMEGLDYSKYRQLFLKFIGKRKTNVVVVTGGAKRGRN